MSASIRSKSFDGDDAVLDLVEVCPVCPSPAPSSLLYPDDPRPEPEGRSSLVKTLLAGALPFSFCACLARSPNEGESWPCPDKQKTKANAHTANRCRLRGLTSSSGPRTQPVHFH